MKIAVLGSGPAGLLAAHACESLGHQVGIFSKSRQTSIITGAQYLHDPIPGLTNSEPDGVIRYHKIGQAAGYAEKVYGNRGAPTSWEIFPVGDHECWSLRKMYNKLWNIWKDRIQVRNVTADWLDEFADRLDAYQLVISAIPAPILCTNPEHTFPRAQVWFEKAFIKDQNLGENFVYYSGEPNDLWYRSSWIFGQGYFEYGDYVELGRDIPATRKLVSGIKPLDTNCDCRPRIVRVGRFGEWKKGRLVHHAYTKTLDALEVVDALY